MKFCSQCASPLTRLIPAGDSQLRFVCQHCATIHYENPKVVVGALAVWGEQVLLCKRAIEPRLGLWTLPAGFMENLETTAQAAERETMEEACARIRLQSLYTLVNVPHISQIHMIYLAQLQDLDFAAGPESLEVALFDEQDIPWADIAFRSISLSLQHFFADRKRGEFHFRVCDLDANTTIAAPTTSESAR